MNEFTDTYADTRNAVDNRGPHFWLMSDEAIVQTLVEAYVDHTEWLKSKIDDLEDAVEAISAASLEEHRVALEEQKADLRERILFHFSQESDAAQRDSLLIALDMKPIEWEFTLTGSIQATYPIEIEQHGLCVSTNVEVTASFEWYVEAESAEEAVEKFETAVYECHTRGGSDLIPNISDLLEETRNATSDEDSIWIEDDSELTTYIKRELAGMESDWNLLHVTATR
jgi:hypothetical protein